MTTYRVHYTVTEHDSVDIDAADQDAAMALFVQLRHNGTLSRYGRFSDIRVEERASG